MAAESAPAAPAEEEDKGGKKLKLKQVLSQAEKYLSRGDYQKAIQLLESARSSDSSKEIMLQLGQAYEFWSEQESGAKQKAITKKAIEAYKQVKNAEAKARIQDLQSRLH